MISLSASSFFVQLIHNLWISCKGIRLCVPLNIQPNHPQETLDIQSKTPYDYR